MSGPPRGPPLQQRIQMDCSPLSALRIGNHNQSVRVRASRVCHHRGGLEDGGVKEMRMVFVDGEGDSMYAIVPGDLVDHNIHRVHETCVYDIGLFEVSDQQRVLNPVANPLVIMFTRLTTVEFIPHPNDMFPEWTYRLTPIADLPLPNDLLRRFVDVIGVIRGISYVSTLEMPGRNLLANRRHVMLADGSGNEMRVTLWGEAALRFPGELIRSLGQDESVVVIFVALAINIIEGRKELAGSSPCRWYINEDIEEVNILRASLQPSFQPIEQLPPPRQMNLRAQLVALYPTRPLSVLLNTDFFHNQDSVFRCIVRIWRLTPGQRWWGTRCAQCGHSSRPVPSSPTEREQYRCSDIYCTSTDAYLEYQLRLLGTDGTGEAEFTLVGSIAQDLIGVSPQQAIRNNSASNVPITNLAVAATQIRHTPPEIAALVSWRYKFVINVRPNSFQGNWASFNVQAVEDSYPPE